MNIVGRPNKKGERLYQENINYQGSLMKIIEYNNSSDIVVEFQDKYKAKVHSQYYSFKNGKIKTD